VKVFAKPSLTRAFKKLNPQKQAAVTASIAGLPDAVERPHLHSGIGIRPFGRYLECRAGLDLRILFYLLDGDIILATTGNHDAIARYVKDN
jgi:hypothetical protein